MNPTKYFSIIKDGHIDEMKMDIFAWKENKQFYSSFLRNLMRQFDYSAICYFDGKTSFIEYKENDLKAAEQLIQYEKQYWKEHSNLNVGVEVL